MSLDTFSNGIVGMLAGFVSLGFLTGCISLEPSAKEPTVVHEMPDEYEISGELAEYVPLNWWAIFNDSILNQLVDSALVANLDLVEAVARLDEVRANLRVTRASSFPAVTASGSVSHQDSPANTGTAALFASVGGDSTGGPGISRFNTTTYSSSIGFSYELDFWGKIRNDTRAAIRDAMSSEADLETVRLGIISETISTYFEIVDLRDRIELGVSTLDVLTERVSQAQERYDRGLVSSFELYQLRQDFRNTQASLPDLESQLTDAEGRLAVLLGTYPGNARQFLLSDLRPTLSFDPVPPGLPAHLLVQRPDVRAAGLRFESARFRVGARRAELFPSLSLNGSAGTSSGDMAGLLDAADQWTLNLAGGLTAPLFQGGRLRASVSVAKARYEQQAAVYARTVLTAFQESVSALDRHANERRRYNFFLAQLEEAEASADLQARRYRSGLVGYSDYLDALRTVFQVRTSLSAAGRQLAMARLGVHRSLGGGWADSAIAPKLELVKSKETALRNPDQ